MIVFEDNEFEISMITYNRVDYVDEWIRNCLDEILKRNIRFTIYDSSTDKKTHDLVEFHRQRYSEGMIQYKYIDSNKDGVKTGKLEGDDDAE